MASDPRALTPPRSCSPCSCLRIDPRRGRTVSPDEQIGWEWRRLESPWLQSLEPRTLKLRFHNASCLLTDLCVIFKTRHVWYIKSKLRVCSTYKSRTVKPICTKLEKLDSSSQWRYFINVKLRKIVLSSILDKRCSCSSENKYDKTKGDFFRRGDYRQKFHKPKTYPGFESRWRRWVQKYFFRWY